MELTSIGDDPGSHAQTQRRIARARSVLDWERRTVDGRKAVLSCVAAPVNYLRDMSETTYYSVGSYMTNEGEANDHKEDYTLLGGHHSTVHNNVEPSLNQLFLLEPSHLSRISSTQTDASLKNIHDNLNAINIDDHTLDDLLSSMGSSTTDDIGHKFENWRAAVSKMVTEARRLESPNTTQLAEAIMDDRAKAFTEAQMSLNNEKIRLSKTKKAILERSNAESAIAAEIEALEKETEGLKMKLFLKERSLRVKLQDLKAADKEHAYQEEKLEHIRDAVFEKEEIVSNVQATLCSERERLKNILHRNIAHLNDSNYV